MNRSLSEREASVDELIEGYFYRGYPYQAIVGLFLLFLSRFVPKGLRSVLFFLGSKLGEG